MAFQHRRTAQWIRPPNWVSSCKETVSDCLPPFCAAVPQFHRRKILLRFLIFAWRHTHTRTTPEGKVGKRRNFPGTSNRVIRESDAPFKGGDTPALSPKPNTSADDVTTSYAHQHINNILRYQSLQSSRTSTVIRPPSKRNVNTMSSTTCKLGNSYTTLDQKFRWRMTVVTVSKGARTTHRAHSSIDETLRMSLTQTFEIFHLVTHPLGAFQASFRATFLDRQQVRAPGSRSHTAHSLQTCTPHLKHPDQRHDKTSLPASDIRDRHAMAPCAAG